MPNTSPSYSVPTVLTVLPEPVEPPVPCVLPALVARSPPASMVRPPASTTVCSCSGRARSRSTHCHSACSLAAASVSGTWPARYWMTTRIDPPCVGLITCELQVSLNLVASLADRKRLLEGGPGGAAGGA